MVYVRVFLTILLLAGCGILSDDKEKKVIAALPKLDRDEVSLEKIWSFSVGDIGLSPDHLKLDPYILSSRIYVASKAGAVFALDKSSGNKLWGHDVGANITGAVSASESVVVVTDDGGVLHALAAADGGELWTAQSSSEILSNAAFSDELVVVQSADSKVQAFGLSAGEKRWTYAASQPALTLRGNASPIIDGDSVIAAFDNGKVVSIDSNTGILRWEERFIIPDGRSELERVVDVQEDPVISGAHVYVGAYQGAVAALSVVTGDVVWDKKASVVYSMSVDGGRLYFVDGRDAVKSVNTSDGMPVWENTAFENRYISSPVVVGDYIVFGDEQGYLHILSAESGGYVGQFHLGAGGVSLGVVSDGSSIYVLANNGTLYAFRIAKG